MWKARQSVSIGRRIALVWMTGHVFLGHAEPQPKEAWKQSLGALVAVGGHANSLSAGSSERRTIRRSLSCECGERLLMRSLALEIDLIVRGNLR